MRTIRTKVYRFSELNAEAKENAIEIFRKRNWDYGYSWSDEINDSYKAICENIAEPLSDIQEEISGARLYTWIQNNLSHLWTKPVYFSKHENGDFKSSTFAYKYDKCIKFRRSRIKVSNEIDNCPFTGVCYDYDFLVPVIDFLKNPSSNITNTDLSEAITDLIDKIHESEQEAQDSEEYITETIEANEYEFTSDGKMISNPIN